MPRAWLGRPAVNASGRAHWAQAEEATLLGDKLPLTTEEKWLAQYRDATLLALGVVSHEHGTTARHVGRATGQWYLSVRVSLRNLERAGLVERDPPDGGVSGFARRDRWLATVEGTRLGVTPYVSRLLQAAKPRYAGRPLRGWSGARFRTLGTENGPPIFRPSFALADVTDPTVLSEALSSRVQEDRKFALAKLIALNDPASVTVLAEVAHRGGTDEQLAHDATVALSRFHTAESVAALIELASHRDSYIREAAVRSLGRLRAVEAIPVLEDLASYPSPSVRSAADTALARIRK